MRILKTLSLQPLHGYGIGRRMEQITGGAFRVNAGPLRTALKLLPREGLLDDEWRGSEPSCRAQNYSQTPAGRRRLEGEEADWRRGAVR